MPTRDYLPQNTDALYQWVENYKAQIAIHGATLGLDATAIQAEQLLCSELNNSIAELRTKQAAFLAAKGAFENAKETRGGNLRKNIAHHKTNPLMTDAIAAALQIKGVYQDFDPATYKAHITAELFAGFVRIKFTKRGADGVNIYHRKKGTIDWLFLARDTKSPYDDHIVLATPGQPEHWEYRAFGILDDLEIGLASDIVEIVVG